MLSYQWDHQKLVTEVYRRLHEKNIPLWMDTQGGMKGHLSDSTTEGVENAAAICCFMTPKYQDSVACKGELTYAKEQGVTITPILVEPNWKPTSWLGFTVTGHKYISFRDADINMDIRIQQLIAEIQMLLVCQIRNQNTILLIYVVRWKCTNCHTNQTRYWFEQLGGPMGSGWQFDEREQEPGTDPVFGYHSETDGVWHNNIQMNPIPPASGGNEWVWDGVKFYAYKTSMGSEKLKPVRRYWNKSDDELPCFCMLPFGTENDEQPGWTFDKILFYALPSDH